MERNTFSSNILGMHSLEEYFVDEPKNKTYDYNGDFLELIEDRFPKKPTYKNIKYLVVGKSMCGKTTHVVKNLAPYILTTHQSIDNIYVFAEEQDSELYSPLVDTVHTELEKLLLIPENSRNLIIIDINFHYGFNFLCSKYPILLKNNSIVVFVTHAVISVDGKSNFDAISCNSHMSESEKQRLFSIFISKLFPGNTCKQFNYQISVAKTCFFTFFDNAELKNLPEKKLKNKIKSKKLTKLNLIRNNCFGAQDVYFFPEQRKQISNWYCCSDLDNGKQYKIKSGDEFPFFKGCGWKNIKIISSNYSNIKSVKLLTRDELYDFNYKFHTFDKDWVLPINYIDIHNHGLIDVKNRVFPSVMFLKVCVEYKNVNESDENYWSSLSETAETYILCEKVSTEFYNQPREIMVYQSCYKDFGESTKHKYDLMKKLFHPTTLLGLKFVNDDNIKNVSLNIELFGEQITLNFKKTDKKYWTIKFPLNNEQNDTINFSRVPNVSISIDGNKYIGFSLIQDHTNIYRIMCEHGGLAYYPQ